ncbi:MAG: BON domain-containing protein [Gammaproteobacteria bacterium]
MSRSTILGLCALAAASVLSGCVIVIGNEDDFDHDYVSDYDDNYDESFDRSGRFGSSDGVLGDVREQFDNDEFLRDEPILIAAEDGVVTLSGEVTQAQAIDRAVTLASRTPGVESVVLKVVLLNTP